MPNPEFFPWKDRYAKQDAEKNLKECLDGLVQFANYHELKVAAPKRNGAPGQTKVCGSVDIIDMLYPQTYSEGSSIFHADNKANPAVSDGKDLGGDEDMKEQKVAFFIEFMEAMQLSNDLESLVGKKITLALNVDDGLASETFTTVITIKSTKEMPKVEMTGPDGALSDAEIKDVENGISKIFVGM